MDATTSVLLSSHSSSLGFSLRSNSAAGNRNVSLGHFNKHLASRKSSTSSGFRRDSKPLGSPLRSSFSVKQWVPLLKITRTHLVSPAKCSYSGYTSPDSSLAQPLLGPYKDLSFEKLKRAVFEVSPVRAVKWFVILAALISAAKWTSNVLFSPFFWSFFSMTWMFWPWMVAVSLAGYGLYCFYRHAKGEASILQQLAIVTSVFAWLTLVPPAHFNGFLEGWPIVFFLVYHYFFFFNVSVRKRLYGDYYGRPHDPKWDVNPPNWSRALFCVGVMIGHWLAAFEGPELHLVPGGWSNVWIWILIVVTSLMQYNSTFYLAKYSEKVVVPTSVVQFGPYRWVRHPMYSSTMLLFAAYFVALRAPLSLVFIVAVSLTYYEKKAKMEEGLMIENFGESYLQYMNKVRYKFIPLVF
ncbi:unnamed protein product [Linum tenue]|uniref:Protein-S-isoprenylcysteine O-methyltransferase n=1 Tax=Linum tenue TaxID=586396 RepID=A0AAV0LGW3_9ROSI|nr:unnamed protein product [Linum tenue]